MTENQLAIQVINQSIAVHQALGPGLLKSAYKEVLYYKLKKEGFYVEKEKSMPLIFEEIELEVGYHIDLLVEEKLVIELKSVEALNEVHLAQMLTYLRLGDFKLGLLMNFNVALLKNGIRRVINSQ